MPKIAISVCIYARCTVLASLLCLYRHLYIQIEDLSEALHKYFLYRCKNGVLFSLQVSGGGWSVVAGGVFA